MTSLAPRRAAPSAATEPSVIDFCFFFMGLFVGPFGAGASARARCASSSAPARHPSPRRRPAARRPHRPAAPQRRGASPPHAHRQGRGAATRWAARNRSLRDQIRQGLRAPRPQGVPGGARLRTRAEGDQEPAARQPSEADHRVALPMVQITKWSKLHRARIASSTKAVHPIVCIHLQ